MCPTLIFVIPIWDYLILYLKSFKNNAHNVIFIRLVTSYHDDIPSLVGVPVSVPGNNIGEFKAGIASLSKFTFSSMLTWHLDSKVSSWMLKLYLMNIIMMIHGGGPNHQAASRESVAQLWEDNILSFDLQFRH